MKLIVTILLIAFSTLSCTPEIELKDAPLGKEAQGDEMQKAIGDALSGISIGNATVNQYVTYVDTARIELGPIYRTRTISHKLTDIQEDASEYRFVIYEDLYVDNLETSDPDDLIDEKHSELTVKFIKSVMSEMNMMTTIRAAAVEDCDGQDVTDESGITYDCIRFYNLRSYANRKAAPPRVVMQKPNCMNIPNCMLDIHFIEYDIVKWKNGKSVQTTTITAEIAKNVPDLLYEQDSDGNWNSIPPSLSFCLKGTRTYEGQKILVTNCSVLNDFQ